MGKNDSENKGKKAFFFLRHNNDIDHIVPVLYKWLSLEKIPTDVIITTKKEFLNDYRIKLLKKFDHVRVIHIKDLVKKYSLSWFFIHYYFKFDTTFDKYIKSVNFVKKKADKAFNFVAEKLFKGVKSAIVVFDWTSIYFVKKIIELSKAKKFTTLSLPHGDAPYINYLIRKQDLNYDCTATHEEYKMFDYVVVPNNLWYKRYERYLDEDKLKLMGSPRYNREWLDIISKFVPKWETKADKKKLKIVFFLRNKGYPIFWDEVAQTIRLILQFPDVYLAVKHHPRNRNPDGLSRIILSMNPEIDKFKNKNFQFIYDDVSSGALMKWADVIIDLGTTVTWESIQNKQPVLMIEYLYANYSTVASYIKGSEIKSRDELYDTIQKLTKHKTNNFYNEKERQKFIKEMIDISDKNVLERYSKFLKKCLDESEKK
jgi:hypothetical protein